MNYPNLLVDSVHPNDESHRILAKKVISYLETQKYV